MMNHLHQILITGISIQVETGQGLSCDITTHGCFFVVVIISISRHLRSTQLCPAFGEHSVFPFVPEIVQVSTFLFHHCQSYC